MRLLLQRVRSASVQVENQPVATIGSGLLVLVAFGAADAPDIPGGRVWQGMLDKMLHLRIFPGEDSRTEDKLERSVLDFGGEVLLVSQFTLYAECRKGRRPGFQGAASPQSAAALFSQWVKDVDARLPHRVGSGIFGASMNVTLCNWGPVTILLDSEELFPSSL